MPGTEEQRTTLRLLLRVARWSLLAFALFWVIIGILALLPIKPNVDTLAFPEDQGGANPEAIVILVHGTFSPGADWTHQLLRLYTQFNVGFRELVFSSIALIGAGFLAEV
jgi:hypothetical protein